MTDPVPPPAAPAAGPVAVGRRRRRRRLVVAVVTLGVVLTSAAVGLTHLASRSAAEGAVDGPDPASTATVERRDLVQHLRASAVVGHDQPRRLTGRRAGTITWLPDPGAVVDRGQRVYEVDAVPVPLFLGAAPLHRPLTEGVDDGADVRLVQENLTAIGFTTEPDGVFGPATKRALTRWQESAGLPATGTLAPGDVVVAPGQVRVDTVTAALGDQGTGPLMSLTGTGRVAVATIEPEQQDLMRPGATIRLTTPSGELAGTVTSVVPQAGDDLTGGGGGGMGGGMGGGVQKYAATIRFDDQRAAAVLLDGASVTAMVESSRADDVLAVPVAALLALREGGYAVEAVDPAGGRRLLAVRAGLFADGMVEVTGDGIAEGVAVVVAS